MDNIYCIPVRTIEGEDTNLAYYADRVMLIVNTASRCGFTPQYAGLEKLYQTYMNRGLIVLGFPCNQFGGQEPGDETQIKKFCSLTYDVTFPMFAKIKVNGKEAHPLYVEIKKRAPGTLGTEAIKWNFTKFLVSPGAKTIQRFASGTTPESICGEIEKLL